MSSKITRLEIFTKIKALAMEERKITLELLASLRLIFEQRWHLEAGYSSMHEFVVKELGYSDGAAWRRVGTMRLLREIPELERKISSGALPLGVAAMVSTRMRSQSTSKKLEVLKELEGKSEKESRRILDRVTEHRPKVEELVLELDQELKALLVEFKERTGENFSADVLKRLLKEKLCRNRKTSAPTGPTHQNCK